MELAGRVVRLRTLRAHPERYAALFDRARRDPGWARCLCTPDGQRLVIRQLGERHHLARWPATADDHRPTCPFFTSQSRAHPAHQDNGPAIAAIENTGDPSSQVRVHLRARFTTPVAVAPDAAAMGEDPEDGDEDEQHTRQRREPGAGARQNTITMLGLLHYLWDISGLNAWRTGDTRHWVDCHAALAAALLSIRFGRAPAPELLHVVAPHRPRTVSDTAGAPPPMTSRPTSPRREAPGGEPGDPAIAAFLHPLSSPLPAVGPHRGTGARRRGPAVRHRRLLLGEIKEISPTAYGHKVRLRHLKPPLFLSSGQFDALSRAHRAAFSERRGPHARRIALVLIERTPHGWLSVVDAAVMLTNSGYLPADSSHEVSMADWLVAHRRSLTKPVRYESSGSTELELAGVFPDFVLTDTDPATVVEVWGIVGRDDYERRKESKRAHYLSAGTPIIDWTVTDPLPDVTRGVDRRLRVEPSNPH